MKDDLPSPHLYVPYTPDQLRADAKARLAAREAARAAAPNTDIMRRIADSLARIVRRQAIELAREHERCGKAACRRAGGCRGRACEPEPHTRREQDIPPRGC